jgi:hypothetical protein
MFTHQFYQFFIHFQRQQRTALVANKCLKYSEGDGSLVHAIRIGWAQAGLDLHCHVNHSRSETEIGRNCDVTEMRRDGTEM